MTNCMVSDQSRVAAEVWWIRLRAKAHTVVKLAGLGLVFLALANVFGPMYLDITPFAPYRGPMLAVLGGVAPFTVLPELIVFAVGLVLTWWG